MNSRFAMAVHILGMLAAAERDGRGPVTSGVMAKSIRTHPVVVRRLISDLTRAGLVETKRGVGGGVSLARAASAISLRQVFEAVEEGTPLFGRHPSDPSPSCPIGACVGEYLEEVFGSADRAVRASLEKSTVEQMIRTLEARMRQRGVSCSK